ncbi:MAG: hypothetical protein JWO20_1748 [Candidatus Angelobacter sp.]|nr:hypothetical protein [Candidatus Angelobacter sp.]
MAQPRTITYPNRRRRKHLIAFTLLGISLLYCARTVNSDRARVGDFAAYWTASHLLLTGQNPYDVDKVFALEKAIGPLPSPLVMRNPPWLVPLILPLGLFSYQASYSLWAILQTSIVVGCALWMWKQFAPSTSTRWVVWLITLTSLPCILVLVMRQTTPLMLLGVVGFLYCEFNDRSNSWLQAGSLVLISLKPQLLYLFWVALALSALWALRDLDKPTRELRRWFLFFRFGVLLAAFSGFAMIFDIRIFSQYFEYLRNTPILQEGIPTIGNFFRLHTELPWTQFAPMFIGVVWALWHWSKRRQNWDWREQMPSILMASVLTTTYSWLYDQVILIPVVLYALAQNFPGRNRVHVTTALLLCLAANAFVFVIFGKSTGLTDFKLLWTWPVYCILYSALGSLARHRSAEEAVPEPEGFTKEEEAPSYASNLAA